MDLFDLYAKLRLDNSDYNDKIGDAREKTSSFAEHLKSGLSTAAKVGAVALGAAATAMGALAKTSIENYAEYEQLAGGVETLFKNSADTVMQYADNAYKTAGLSANEYMTTVTSFSASLLQSLGGNTEAAAKMADMAITDMSDNANKMGSSMGDIQNAYQGFAKQNYTMLDNLKLGYGGTKEEMERLLEDATALSGVEYDVSSYADVVEAIHVVQTQLGITGTTALEASTTIQGSVSAMKSAWANLLTGMADESQDMGALMGNFVDSVVTVAGNIVPRIVELLPRLVQGVTELVQQFVPMLPPIVGQLLPSVIEGAMALLDGIVQSLPTIVMVTANAVPMIVEGLVGMLPLIVEAGISLIISLAQGIAESLPALVPAAVDAVMTVIDTLLNNVELLIDTAGKLMVGLANGLILALPTLIEKAPQIIVRLVTELIANLPKILEVGVQVILALVDGIIKSWPELKQAGQNMIDGLWQGIQDAWGALTRNFGSLVNSLVDEVKGWLGIASPSKVFAGIGKNMALGLENGWDAEVGTLTADVNRSLSFEASGASAGARSPGGDIIINVTGVFSRPEDAQSMGNELAITLQRELRYKGVLA